MAELATVFIRVRADSARARRELKDMKDEARQLDRMRVDIKVKVDGAAGSIAQLEALKRKVNELQRQRGIKLDTRIDTSGMTALGKSIGMVTAGIPALTGGLGLVLGAATSLATGFVSLSSAIAPAAGALAAVPALAGAAAQGFGVAAASLYGIGDAVKAMFNVDKAAGQVAQTTAAARVASAERIREANNSLENALRSQHQTALSGARSVRDAERQLAETVTSAHQRVEDAERSLQDAQRASRDAQRDLNEARKDARRDIEDLKDSLKDAALSEEDAQIGLARAQERMQEYASGARKGTQLDMREANLAVRQAQQRLVEVRKNHKEVADQVADANKNGVEGAAQVVAARERVTDASRNEADAARGVRDAQVKASQDITKAQENVADAQASAAEANRNASRAVAEAQREVAEAAKKSEIAMAKQSSQATGLAYALSQISPKAREFARYLHDDLIPALVEIQWAGQDAFLPKLQQGLELLRPLLPIFRKGVVDTANALGDLAIEGGKMLSSGPWRADFATLVDNNSRLVSTYGHILFNLLDAFRDLAVAAIPLANHIADFALTLSESIKTFTDTQRTTGGLTRFFEATWEVLQRLGRIVGNVAQALVGVGVAGRDAGNILLDSIEGVTAKWRDFTKSTEGRNSMRQYFLDAVPVQQETGKLLADIAKGLLGLGANPNIASLIAQIRTQLLPAFGRLTTAVSGETGAAIIDFLADLVNLIADLTEEGGALQGFVGTLDSMVEGFRNLLANKDISPIVGGLLKMAGTAGALLLVGGAVGKVGAAFKKVIGPVMAVMRWLGPLMGIGGAAAGAEGAAVGGAAAASGPFAPLVLGALALGAGLVVLYQKSEGFRQFVRDIGTFITTEVMPALRGFGDWIMTKAVPAIELLAGQVGQNLKPILDQLGATFRKDIQPALAELWTVIERDLWPTLEDLATVVGVVMAALLLLWSKIDGLVIPVLIQIAGPVITNMINNFKLTIEVIKTVLDTFEHIGTGIGNAMSAAKDVVVGAFKAMRDNGKGYIDNLVEFVAGLPKRGKEALGNLGELLKQGVGSGLKTVFDFIDTNLIGNLNKVTGKFGVNVPTINFQGFAKGGVVPGYAPGVDNFPAMLSPGEAILTPQTVRAIGGETTIEMLNKLGPGAGGAWDTIKSVGAAAKHDITAAGSAAKHAAQAGAGFVVDVAGDVEKNLQNGYAYALQHLVNPFIERFDAAFGGSTFGQFTVGVLRQMRDKATGKAEAADNAAEGSGLAGGLGALVGAVADRISGGVAFPLPRGSYRVGVPPFGYPGHRGQDFPAPTGTPVFAPIGGLFVPRVLRNPNGTYRSYGNMGNVFAPSGLQFIAAHMSAFARGQGLVRPGDLIGRVGSTGNSSGPHLHAEFRRLGAYVDPRTVLPRYDTGGLLPHGSIAVNTSGRPERILTARQNGHLERLLAAVERGGGTNNSRTNTVVVNVETKNRRIGYEVGDAVVNTMFLNGWA